MPRLLLRKAVLKMKISDSFKGKFETYIGIVNDALDKFVAQRDNPQKIVYESMRYSLLAGGKRIRPVLCLAIADCFGTDKNKVLPFACSIEMIHTYSLIHDDLPAMDDDDYRRGRLSSHKKFDEATAILAGDALLTYAFEVATQGALLSDNKLKGICAVKLIAQAAGTEGMIGGQIVDTVSVTPNPTVDDVRYMCDRKTGALLKVPAEVAVVLSDISDAAISDLMIDYAKTIGLAFQVKDDILDEETDTAPNTFIAVLGREKSEKLLSELTDKALGICDVLNTFNSIDQESVDFLRDLAIFLLERQI